MTDPMLPPGRNFCKCAACGTYFTSPSTFDAHRTGPHAKRRCLTPEECGFTPDHMGRYGQVAGQEEAA